MKSRFIRAGAILLIITSGLLVTSPAFATTIGTDISVSGNLTVAGNSTTTNATTTGSGYFAGTLAVGATSPGAVFQIGQNTATLPANTGFWMNGGQYFRIGTTDANADFGSYLRPSFTSSSTVSMGTRYGGVDTDALTILGAWVGVDTTAPEAMLQIGTNVGSVPANTSLWITGGQFVRLGSSDSNAGYGSYLQPTFGSQGAGLIFGITNGAVDKGMLSLTQNGLSIGTSAAPNAALDVASSTIIIENSKTPATSSAACTTGSIAWDSGFVYVCVATNTWKRAAIATW